MHQSRKFKLPLLIELTRCHPDQCFHEAVGLNYWQKVIKLTLDEQFACVGLFRNVFRVKP